MLRGLHLRSTVTLMAGSLTLAGCSAFTNEDDTEVSGRFDSVPSSLIPDPVTTPTETDETAAPGKYTRHATVIDGIERTWNVYTPDSASVDNGANRDPLPVALMFHGSGGTGDDMHLSLGSDLEARAERDVVAIAYIDGYENNWNDCRDQGDWPAKLLDIDDTALVRTIVDDLDEDLSQSQGQVRGQDSGTVDRDRIFAIGFSSGGQMAQRLAFEADDLVTGIAVVAAKVPLPSNNNCTPQGDPVSAIFVQNRFDPGVPYQQSEAFVGEEQTEHNLGYMTGAVDGAQFFAMRNGIDAKEDTEPAPGFEHDVEIKNWSGEHPVQLITVDQEAHTFPTAEGAGVDFDAPGAIWQFFADASHLHRR